MKGIFKILPLALFNPDWTPCQAIMGVPPGVFQYHFSKMIRRTSHLDRQITSYRLDIRHAKSSDLSVYFRLPCPNDFVKMIRKSTQKRFQSSAVTSHKINNCPLSKDRLSTIWSSAGVGKRAETLFARCG